MKYKGLILKIAYSSKFHNCNNRGKSYRVCKNLNCSIFENLLFILINVIE